MNKFKDYLEKTQEIGRISGINHSIIKVSGLPTLQLNEMIIAQDGQRGIAYNLGPELAEILMLDTEGLEVNKAVTRTNETLQLEVNSNFLGRTVDPLGRPVDGKGPISGEKESQPLENLAPNITQRTRVKRHLQTGVTKVDLLIPLGYGQRETILGDKKTGKTTFLLQVIANQVRQGTICIYVSIGKRASDLKIVESYLTQMGVSDQVIIVRAGAGEPSPVVYLAPYSGMSIAEYFRNQGKDVLIIFDDLSTHAKIYRELSLLLNRPPGRSSYPGDIFHIHAALLERAGNMKIEGQEVSITALPVVNTLGNDISGYIQTNLMAITDGHIFFDSQEFRKGIKPAINAFLSVSRVGNQTKKSLDQEIARVIRKKMSDYRRALEVARFGMELPEETRGILDFGKKLEVIFSQGATTLLSREFQLLLLGLLICGYWEKKSPIQLEKEISTLSKHYQAGALLEMGRKIDKAQNLEEFKKMTQDLIPELEKL